MAVKIIDLPGSLLEGRQQGGPLYLSVAGMMIPIVVFLSPRLRRWIRRLVTYGVLSDLWAQVRPKQQHDHRQYTVLMDLVPSLQPWSLQETAAW